MQTTDTYRALVASSDIAIAVLLNSDGTDGEVIPLRPWPLPDGTIRELETRWAPRRLQLMGVMAWKDGATQTLFEQLPDAIVARLNRAFAAYLAAFCTNSTVN